MIYWLIIAVVIALDQATKVWIAANLEMFQSNTVIPGFFDLTYVTNTGAAFSILADIDSPWIHYFFISISVVALVILTSIWYRNRKGDVMFHIALALIFAGAAGNLIDRVRLGAVIDFIDVYIGSRHWPAFNVADSAICVGVVLYLILGYLEDRKKSVEQGGCT